MSVDFRALGAWSWNEKVRSTDGLPYEFVHGIDLLGYMQCELNRLKTSLVTDHDKKRLIRLASCHAKLAKSETPIGALIKNLQADMRLDIEQLVAANDVSAREDLGYPLFKKHERPRALKLKLALIAMRHPFLCRTQNKLIWMEKTWNLLSNGYTGNDREKLVRKLVRDLENFMRNDRTEYRYWYSAVCGNLFKKRVYSLNLELIAAKGSWRVGMPLLNQRALEDWKNKQRLK